jgi:ornithine carbamoyltransferase
MQGRHFLAVTDFSSDELKKVLSLAHRLKKERKEGVKHRVLDGKSLAMIFQKPSNRTRVSFEVGMFELGGTAINIRPSEIDMGLRETVPDVSKVISRYVSCAMLRVLRHADLVQFARHATIPVINGLSDHHHPCQAVADVMTIEEQKGKLPGLKVCYVGDGNNVCNSLIEICSRLDMEIVVSCPKGYDPTLNSKEFPYEIIRDPFEAVKNSSVIYTDVWTSMGQEAETIARLRAFDGYTVNRKMLKNAKKDAIFMHCLPAHRGEEVEAQVVDSSQSVVFDQAENRMHAQKAILSLVMGGIVVSGME